MCLGSRVTHRSNPLTARRSPNTHTHTHTPPVLISSIQAHMHKCEQNHMCTHSHTHTHVCTFTNIMQAFAHTYANIHPSPWCRLQRVLPEADTFHASVRTSRKPKHEFAAREGCSRAANPSVTTLHRVSFSWKEDWYGQALGPRGRAFGPLGAESCSKSGI